MKRKLINVYGDRYYPPQESHEFIKWQSFDGEISYEAVCRCGFHSADDDLFMAHCEKKKEADHEAK